jgi:hypothetical protein
VPPYYSGQKLFDFSTNWVVNVVMFNSKARLMAKLQKLEAKYPKARNPDVQRRMEKLRAKIADF